jgi:hypothetical protein
VRFGSKQLSTRRKCGAANQTFPILRESAKRSAATLYIESRAESFAAGLSNTHVKTTLIRIAAKSSIRKSRI